MALPGCVTSDTILNLSFKAHQWVVKKLLDGALMSMSTANQKRSFLS